MNFDTVLLTQSLCPMFCGTWVQEVWKLHSMRGSGVITRLFCDAVQFMCHKMTSMWSRFQKKMDLFNKITTKLDNEMVSNCETLAPQRSSLVIIWSSAYKISGT